MEFIERHHLKVLREIERRGSLTAAARSLGLTQSALSHTIKQLEEAAGVDVLRRKGRGLERTSTGDYLLGLSERVLPQFEQAEATLLEFKSGRRGTLRIGMECHPCYRWLLSVISPYLKQFPSVDVDVRQRFQFGGIGALFSHEIDVLVTPDPLPKKGLIFTPVFDYELRLAVSQSHPLAKKKSLVPADLRRETLFTYPVEVERLDIYSQFLLPAEVIPSRRKVLESTDIMLQMVESGRGVTALPGWLVSEYARRLALRSLRLGRKGIKKQIYLGVRQEEAELDHVKTFLRFAKRRGQKGRKDQSQFSDPSF